MMKNLMKLFLIVFMFFTTLSANAGELNINHLESNINTIQTESSQIPYIEEKTTTPKHYAPANQNTVAMLFSSIKNDSNTNFTSYKNGVSPKNHQFSLLVSYIYNKSYLLTETFRTKNFPLTEINRNAP